jgi:hypothetical protein
MTLEKGSSVMVALENTISTVFVTRAPTVPRGPLYVIDENMNVLKKITSCTVEKTAVPP